MAGTIREEIAGLRAGIAALGVQNAGFERRIARLEHAKPSTNRAQRKVAEPRKAIKSSRPKRNTHCKMHGCDRMFFSNVGARSHNCR